MNKVETIENFEVNFKKHPFSKSIKITLKKEGSILVTMPYLCPYKTARNFLMSNFEKIKSFEVPQKILPKNLSTKFDTLKIIEADCLKTKVENRIVCFYYPSEMDFSDKVLQKELKEAYLKAIKIEAKNYLPSRLEFLAKKYGFSYQNIALRNQKTRFGSCSFNNNINFFLSRNYAIY